MSICLFDCLFVCLRLSVPHVFVHEIDEKPHGSSQRIKLLNY